MLLAVVMSVMGASVEVAVDAPCVEAAFSGRLASAGVVLPTDTTLSLRRARAEVLEVTLKPRGAAPMRREVPAAARDCAGVERVVVALVKAWLASPVMVARAGRDGGAPRLDGGAVVEGEVQVPDGGALVRADAGADGRAGRSVRAGVDAGGDGNAPSTARGAVDGGAATPLRADAGGAATTEVRGAGTATRGDGDGAPTPLRTDAGGAATTEVRGAGTAARGDGDGAPTPLRADAGGAARAEVPGVVDGGLVRPSRLDVADDDVRRASAVRAAGDAGALAGTATSSLEPDVTRVVDAGADALPVVAADAGSDAPLWSFGVGLLGGIASGTTTDIVPQGLLSVDVTRGWFGAALDVGLSGNVSRQVPPGAVTSSWQWLSLSARAVWAPLERVTLDVQLGGRAHRVVALATGYAETKPEQQLFSVGAVGSVGASVRIVGPVGLTVRATGVVKPAERFTIDNLGAVLDLGSLEGGVHAGVVVRW